MDKVTQTRATQTNATQSTKTKLKEFIVISGTSGSGKSIALNALEDLGFYCIDNLPAVLLTHVASNMFDDEQPNIEHDYAVSVDSRNQNFLQNVDTQLGILDEMRINYKIIFLDADDDTLIKRFSETRRKHPLSDEHVSLVEAIALERKILSPIEERSSIQINTSKTTPHELRASMRDYVADTDSASLTLLLESFGFKYGTPTEADFMFDVRCLPNPYWDENLRSYTGLDEQVQDYLASHDVVNNMFIDIRDFIEKWLPFFRAGDRTYITIAIGCTGGKHRSVYLSNKLQEHFSNSDNNDNVTTQIRHRELNI